MIQSTVHCNKRWCHRWAPHDPETEDALPPGWVAVAISGRDEQHFCSVGHAGEWLAWMAVAATASDPQIALAQM